MINTRNREPGQMQGDTQEPTGPGGEAERGSERRPMGTHGGSKWSDAGRGATARGQGLGA